MTDIRKFLANRAMSSALRVRISNGYTLTDAISVFDLASKLKIELLFQSLPSLEGMYSPTPIPAIVIGTQRPAARQVFTCAHEIGHHIFGHGTKVDEYTERHPSGRAFDEEEFLAQTFGGFLLLPKVAIQNQIRKRGISLGGVSPEPLYKLANYFGVGYKTILNHLRYSLGQISASDFERLNRISVAEIRRTLVGSKSNAPLVCADEHWSNVPIDLEVGDDLLTPQGSQFEGRALVTDTGANGITLFRAIAQGQGRILNNSKGWAAFVRVRPKNYSGRAMFRHLEADD